MVIVIAVTSLEGSASGVICDAEIRLLFIYITDRGCVSSGTVVNGSTSVHV